MIALKSVAVLLAVSALAVLVQSSGVPDGHPGEIELNRDGCLRYFIEKLKNFNIIPELMELVEFSREHYPKTLEDLMQKRSPVYEAAMRTIPFPSPICDPVFDLFSSLYEDPQCGEYIMIEEDSLHFMLNIVQLSVEAKTRVESIRACFHAGGAPTDDYMMLGVV